MEFEAFVLVFFLCFLAIISLGQIIIPLLSGNPLFPSFRAPVTRKSIEQLREELKSAEEEVERVRLEKEIADKRTQAFRLTMELAAQDPLSTNSTQNNSTQKPLSE